MQKGKRVTVKVRKQQKGNGGHSKHHAQTDAGKEKGNGGHFLDKQKGKARNPSGKETQREWRTLSRQTKGNWGSKKEMEGNGGQAYCGWPTAVVALL